MPISGTWNNVLYSVPQAGELNWASLTNFLSALLSHAAIDEEWRQAIRVATASPVTVASATDCTVVVKLTVPGASAVNLPVGVDRQLFIIVDGNQDAATNNITISPNGAETINGAASLVLSRNGAVTILQYLASATDWKVISNSADTSLSSQGLLSNNILANSLTVLSGTTLVYPNLVIPSGKTLTINSGAFAEVLDTFTNNGTLVNNGTFRVI